MNGLSYGASVVPHSEKLEFYNGQELMDGLDLTVSEDREKLDDFEASLARGHFKT
jgi:hypothetical protein